MSDFEYVYGASVTHNGGANLLGDSWTKTPAASGSEAYQTTSDPGVRRRFRKVRHILSDFRDHAGGALRTHLRLRRKHLRAFRSLGLFAQCYFATERALQFKLASGARFCASAPCAPEPSTWAMMLIGLAGLGSLRYRWREVVGARGVEGRRAPCSEACRVRRRRAEASASDFPSRSDGSGREPGQTVFARVGGCVSSSLILNRHEHAAHLASRDWTPAWLGRFERRRWAVLHGARPPRCGAVAQHSEFAPTAGTSPGQAMGLGSASAASGC